MNFKRYLRHVWMTQFQAQRAFPTAAQDHIEQAVWLGERSHRAELRVVIEQELTTAQLWRNLTPRERAAGLFAELKMASTQEKTGVLLYINQADRAVELLADKGINDCVPPETWVTIVRALQQAYAGKHYEAGTVAAVAAISAVLIAHFPAAAGARNDNELPDRPLML